MAHSPSHPCLLPIPIHSRPHQPAPQPALDPNLQLLRLPDELLHCILERLDPVSLKSLALVSRYAHECAIVHLWQSVNLVDCWTLYPSADPADGEQWGPRGFGLLDDHDDTPCLNRLTILARNPHIASKVQTLTHRCHLPTPAIFTELPRVSFKCRTLSSDPRTLALVALAAKNLVNLQCLRIVFGHWNLTLALLKTLLAPDRPCRVPLRRLWLESVALEGLDDKTILQFHGLESLRIRRLYLEPRAEDNEDRLVYSRAGRPWDMLNGAGGTYKTSIDPLEPTHDMPSLRSSQLTKFRPSAALSPDIVYLETPRNYDNQIFASLPEANDLALKALNLETSRSGDCNWDLDHSIETLYPVPAHITFLRGLQSASQTLTSLNLDWIYWATDSVRSELNVPLTLTELASLRFPHLRAFQLRNAVISGTLLPYHVYLLDMCHDNRPCFLEFMEAHPNLRCLAWPMDRFYRARTASTSIAYRAQSVVANLARTLVELRVDSEYDSDGEPFTDENVFGHDGDTRQRRRAFIEKFCPYMRKVECLKMEGGIPRDEKREVIRALHHCDLKKLVLIGVCCPIGNTWGENARDLRVVDLGNQLYNGILEGEDLRAILACSRKPPKCPSSFEFTPEYGSHPAPPIIYTIAMHHAATLTELKFCGYSGSPVLSKPTPSTHVILESLKYFHNLRRLVLSLWLITYNEHNYRDEEIISFWKDSRPATQNDLVPCTALALAPTPLSSDLPTPPFSGDDGGSSSDSSDDDEDTGSENSLDNGDESINTMISPPPPNLWAETLRTQYSPEALAQRIASQIGSYLSPEAKVQPGGVQIRGSFCLGIHSRDIFDMDVRVGPGDTVLQFTGPREEGETNRWWSKLEARRWFY